MTKNAEREAGSGCLYLVATPIGNLEDITLRAINILKEADVIACEDTRQTQKLLQHLGIRKEMVSYHDHNELTRSPELVIEMEQGAKVALVSDAGTPGISDPGHRLVSLCLRHHIQVVPIPGPSALVAALTASGLPTEGFLFAGFLSPRAGARRKELDALKAEPRTLVFYEAPHRIVETLSDALDILGPRPAVIAREITKIHEEFLRGKLSDLLDAARKRLPPRRNHAPDRAGRSRGSARRYGNIAAKARGADRSRNGRGPQSSTQASRARARSRQARCVQATPAGTLEFTSLYKSAGGRKPSGADFSLRAFGLIWRSLRTDRAISQIAI